MNKFQITIHYHVNLPVGMDLQETPQHPKTVTSSFLCFAEEEILRLTHNHRASTSGNYRTALRSFFAFLKGSDISISDITPELVVDYETWLKKNKICLNTISCYMRSLRALYNKAVGKQLVEQTHPFAKVFTGMEKTLKRAVTIDDIQSLHTLDLKAGSPLAWARDLFLFSFFARGMPFVDMAYLKKTQVSNGYLIYYRHKTHQQIRVKLEPCMLAIMQRYETAENEYIFPILNSSLGADESLLSKQYHNGLCYYNKLLKKLSALLGNHCHLSSYVSRHTWASIAYQLQIDMPIISQGLGHTSIQTTHIYVKELDNSWVDESNKKIISRMLREDFLPPYKN